MLYVLSVHDRMSFAEVQEIVRERFEIEITDSVLEQLRREGILELHYTRFCSLTDKGRDKLSL